MSRKQREVILTSGEQFPSLADAQRAALAATADDLTATIRRLLQTGRLVNANGKITPAR